VVGCLNDVEVGQTEARTTEAPVADAAPQCVPISCGGRTLQCGDCKDNDKDGLVDANDPDCYGPCSNSEATLAGRTQPCETSTCFFDFDCGSGNDQHCMDLVPNGCDCHGCCQVGAGSVSLASVDSKGKPTCTFATLSDPGACQACTLDPACSNPCDACEVCFDSVLLNDGCTAAADCADSVCPAGSAACSPQCGIGCDDGLACITGCCVDPR
jgi:hypothetical protein